MLIVCQRSQEQALEVPLEDLSMWHEQTEEMLISCDQAKVLTQQLLSLSRDRRAEKSICYTVSL